MPRIWNRAARQSQKKDDRNDRATLRESLRRTPAANHERFFVPAIGAPLAADLIRHAALREGERVLDVACGTGIVARHASQQIGDTGTVTGLDVNPGMLEAAPSATPPDTPIEWIAASAEAIPLPDASLDVVLCQMGLQFVPDKHAALREMWRVLVRGCRLILNVPGPTPRLFAAMGESLARHVGAEAARFVALSNSGYIRWRVVYGVRS